MLPAGEASSGPVAEFRRLGPTVFRRFWEEGRRCTTRDCGTAGPAERVVFRRHLVRAGRSGGRPMVSSGRRPVATRRPVQLFCLIMCRFSCECRGAAVFPAAPRVCLTRRPMAWPTATGSIWPSCCSSRRASLGYSPAGDGADGAARRPRPGGRRHGGAEHAQPRRRRRRRRPPPPPRVVPSPRSHCHASDTACGLRADVSY